MNCGNSKCWNDTYSCLISPKTRVMLIEATATSINFDSTEYGPRAAVLQAYPQEPATASPSNHTSIAGVIAISITSVIATLLILGLLFIYHRRILKWFVKRDSRPTFDVNYRSRRTKRLRGAKHTDGEIPLHALPPSSLRSSTSDLVLLDITQERNKNTSYQVPPAEIESCISKSYQNYSQP